MQEKPLPEAFNQLSNLFDVSFAVASDLINHDLIVNIQGIHSLDSALAKLLENTALTYEISPIGVLILASSPLKKAAEQPVIDYIVVTGIRQSLVRSRDIKHKTLQISDAIVAQDMANYPDINLAESLQRVPGVTITREAGEGRQLSIRGTLPDFTQVTLNGMPVLANNDSPMDSRQQKQRDRSFDFNIFSSELFHQAQVFKAYSAEQLSGGLAGTVALKTAKPFDRAGFNLVLSPQIGSNQYTDKLAHRITGLISNTWGDWGALLSVSYGNRYAEERGANTFRWRQIVLENEPLTPLPEHIQTSWLNGEIHVARGNRYSIWQSDQSRLGLGTVVQYEGDKSSFTVDILNAILDSDRTEYHLYPRGEQSTPIINGKTKVTDAQVNAQNELVYSAYKDARVATESRVQKTQTDYNQIVFNGQFRLTEKLKLHLITGLEESNFDIPLSNKIYTQGVSNVSIDYRPDRFFANIQYGSDLLAAELWKMREIDLEEYTAHTHYQHSNMEISYQFTSTLSGLTGLAYTRFENNSLSLFQDNLLLDEWKAFASGTPEGEQNAYGITSLDNTLPSHLAQPLVNHPNADWLTLQTNEAMTFWGIDPFIMTNNDQDISRLHSQMTETTTSAYALLNWVKTPFEIMLGLRAQQEYVSARHLLLDENLVSKQDNISWLPSVNLSWELEPDWFVRASISRNTARPALIDITSPLQYNEQTKTVQGFNNSLTPYLSNNLDVSLEGYLNDNVMFSLSAFYKHISDVVAPQSEKLLFGDTGLPNIWPETDLNENTSITLVTKSNHESAKLSGLETMLRYEWAHLVEPWKHMGVIAHYTFTNGSMNYYNSITGEKLFEKAFPYLSRQTASLTLYYEKQNVSTRLSASYRDKYLHQVNTNTLSDEDENGFHATMYIDASFSWALNKQWVIKLDAQNLSNEREEQYSDSSNRPYNSSTSGRTYYLGLTYRH